jgi:hypothetical protein
MKYRIVKVTETVDNIDKIYYQIQKRIFIWWVFVPIEIIYYIYNNCHGFKSENYPNYLVTKKIFVLSTQKDAELILSKLKQPFSILYKNNRIERIFDQSNFSDVYVNRSFYEKTNCNLFKGYEYNVSLEDLKRKIATRTHKPTITKSIDILNFEKHE